MNLKANQEKVEGRFDKVLSYYWDGVPVPLLTDTDKKCSHTFICRQLAFTPDYHGETTSVSLVEPIQTVLFESLATRVSEPQPASCRIGSHYSFYVGLFRFYEGKGRRAAESVGQRVSVRVPVEFCENADECSREIFIAHCRVRTEKLVALYKPLIKEHLPLSRNSLRNIIILSSRGCTSVSREIIAREISDVNEEYANALSEAIFYYMCLNPLQRRILEPLQLATVPQTASQSLNKPFYAVTTSSRQNLNEARQQLKKQLFWSASTRGYFAALQTLWETKFDRLVIINTDIFSNTVEVPAFIRQMTNSIRSVLSRIRIEFYANVEEFFFALIPTANAALLISENEYESSAFRRIFAATEVFLVNKLRSLVFDNLDKLCDYFNHDGEGSSSVTRVSRPAKLRSFINLELVAGESFQPRAPSMALLAFGMRDLFAEIESGVNSLPSIGCVTLRTLKLQQKKLSVISHVEMASYRASFSQTLNAVTAVVDAILMAYNDFCVIPVQNLSAVKNGSEVDMTASVQYARQQILQIHRASRRQLYCGRFQVTCAKIQDTLTQEWQHYLSRLTTAYQKTIVNIAESAGIRSAAVFKIFDTVPSNVEELEAHLKNTEAAKLLAHELRNVDCKSILAKVACMEELYIPIEQDICNAIFEFMKLPEALRRGAEKAGDVRARCAPLLRRKVNQLRAATQEYMQTLSTGVTELYHLFNLETCDIAAQTCAELRELVDRIDSNLQKIAHEEAVLGLPAENTFESFPSLLHYFEAIEQFWNAIFDATKLREMYNSPISSVNASASVEKVREWRRLIHSSARHLRGFPLLLQLGREQEVALSKYEELELFLEVVSSPNLRKNHWKDIAKLIAGQLREDVASVLDLSITVKRLLDAGLTDHMGPLGQIANQAQCDYEVETELEEMRSYGKRTHFVFEDAQNGGAEAVTFVAQDFIAEAAGHVEQFVMRCRAMRRYPNLGQLVQKPLLEWEFSCEKSGEMLGAFEVVQERCAWLENCLQTLQMTPTGKRSADSNRHAIIQHLSSASDAVKRLHTALRKPQFSLYTAMVQDTIQDAFFVVKGAVESALELFRQNLEQRRTAFPRYRFLSDNQLVQFQFVLVTASFVPLFPSFYSQLADVEVVNGEVTAVVAVDGASLPLLSPVSLVAPFPDAWLVHFDSVVRHSLLAAVRNCVTAFYRTDLETWVSAWCGQVVVLALRILHTEGMRHAVEIGGVDALRAYGSKLADMCCALSQLALETNQAQSVAGAQSSGNEETIRAALAYEQFALQETKLAMEWGVRSVADLDWTKFLQTSFTPSGDSIRVTFMGVYIEYGLDFLGHNGAPFMNSTQWKQMAMVMADMELGRSIPLVFGEDDAEIGNHILRNAAQLLGRSYLHVELTPQTVAETLAPLLRGCVETGTFLCLANCERLSTAVLVSCVLPLLQAYRSPDQAERWELPYGPLGAVVSVPVHPFFRVACTSRSPADSALQISTLCETVRITSPDIAELLHGLLIQAGVISLAPLSVEELELAELYKQLQEREPRVFTTKQLHVILRDLIASGDGTAEDESSFGVASTPLSLSRRFLNSLMQMNCGAFQGESGAALHHSLVAQMKAKLLLPSCKDAGLQEWFASAALDEAHITCDEGMERFATLIKLHRRVLIIGPRFSGKSELWKKWVGETPSLVLSPQLMTASDFYGSGSQRGYLAQMESQMALTKGAKAVPVVVLEGVDAPSTFHLFAHTWFNGTRNPEGATNGTCVAAALSLRVIATAIEVRHITPGVVDGFAMLALTGASCWRTTIKWGLCAVPEGEVAGKVLEVLLPPLVERAAKMSPQIVGSASELANMCAIAQRAASLCSRWYTYAQTIRTHSDVLASQDDDDEVDLRLFAARCAVMAASWSVGLSLPSTDRDAVKLTLLAAEADVMKALAGANLSGEVFPELGYNSISPLEQVVLPKGWMALDDAAKRTDLPLSWSDYRNMNPQLQTSLQVFAMPSRVPTLRSMECLMNCGQHILLHAGSVSGRTTLLHTMRTCENWVTQVFQMNAGFRPTEMQQTMTRALTKRSNGRYGPPLGRRLVVCIDDLHLSPAAPHGDGAPLAGALMSYCEKFRAVSTPALGTVPVSDVVFCASTLLHALSREHYSVGALSGCVDVLLPPFDGDEIAGGLLQLCDTASSRKRAKGFPQECAAFLDLAHGAYCQLKRRCTPLGSPNTSSSVTFPAQGTEGTRAMAAPPAASPGDAGSIEEGAAGLQRRSSLFLTEHFRDLLEAMEVVRLLLLSTVSDFQVSARVFIGVTTFYDELLAPPTNALSARSAGWPSEAAHRKHTWQVSREFRNAIVHAAEGTLRNSIRGSVEFRDLAHELPESFSRDAVSVDDESHVAQRIINFQDVLEEEEETDLMMLEGRRKAGAAKRTQRSGSTIRSETRHASILLSYPDSLKVAAVRAEGPNKEVYVRRSSNAVAASMKSSRRVSSTSTVMSETLSSVAQHQPPASLATPTYQTTWLTTRFIHLADALSVPGAHLLLLGDNTFGLRRLFRLWCASSHVPFMWFRVNTADTSRAAIDTFTAELRATIAFVCRNSVHAVAYVPPPLLRMPEVLRVMDAIVRSGDVSSLFTDEERFGLLSGTNTAHVRSLKHFVFADDSELRDRVRGSLNFVFHLHDAAEARELGEGYPFLVQSSTTSLPLYTEKLEASMLEELALGILYNSDAYASGIRKLEDEDDTLFAGASTADEGGEEGDYSRRLSPRAACTALCAAFACVRRVHPATVEQFIAFVRLYKELDSTARVAVLASARTGKVIAGRADAAVQAVNAATQRSRAIVEELAALQIKVALLTEKLTGQERQHAARVAGAEQAQKALQIAKSAIQKGQSGIAKGLEDAKEKVATALKQLRKAKSGSVRALSMSRLPDKGTLLVRALYALLGEEVPKHNDNASELWTLSMKRMCTKEFVADLAKPAPESSTHRLATLLPYRRELDMVRYAPALPYAQLLAEFVVAWVDCVRFLAEDYITRVAEIVKAQEGCQEDEAALEEKQKEAAQAEAAAAKTRSEVAALQKALATLQKEQNDLAGSEGRLLKYTGLVDRFTRFLAGAAGVSERVKRAQCATGDTLLVAAFYTLVAMYEDAPSLTALLQDALAEALPNTQLRFSPVHEACPQLLYQTHAPRTEALTEAACNVPWEYKAVLLALFQRRASRWTLVGGGGPVIAHELRKFLALCCNGSVTVSAADPSAKERLVAAMRAGEGVLLRDVHGAASLDLVRSLNPVYKKLKEYHAGLRRAQVNPKGGPRAVAPSQSATKRAPVRASKVEATRPIMSVWFDGQEVSVHPQFFLVCTCFPAVTSGLPEACESVDVFNLHRPLTHDARLEWLTYAVISKPSISTKIASMQEEVQTRLQVYFEVLQDFIDGHDAAAELLATDLRDIGGNRRGDALLAEMERALAQVDTYDGQMAQTASYVQSLQRMVQEGWDIVFPAIKAVARATEQIETNRLGRPWHASGLESSIAGIAELSPALIRRIAPLSFSDLPIGQKCYYTLTQYLQRVVEMLAPGWPRALRGIFSLCILCTTMSAAAATFATEAKVRMLTSEQRRVLARLVYDKATHEAADTAAGGLGRPSLSFAAVATNALEESERIAEVVRQLYATSNDKLLRGLAGVSGEVSDEEAEDGFSAGDETSYDVVQLFTALLELDVERASGHAASLYSTFMGGVTGLHKNGDRGAARAAGGHDGANGATRSRHTAPLYASSMTDSGYDGGRGGNGASESSDHGSLQAEMPTVEAQIQRAVKARLPLCVVSESQAEDALMFLQDEIKETRWAFQWQELPPPTPEVSRSFTDAAHGDAAAALSGRAALLQSFERVTQLVVSLARGPCPPESCGVCLTLVVDVKEGTSVSTVAAADLLLFREQWHRLLTLYTTTASLRASNGAAPMMCLALVCSVEGQNMIWGQTPPSTSTSMPSSTAVRCAETAPCCYFALSAYTPQVALVELLRPSRHFFTRNGPMQVCECIVEQVQAELASRAEKAAASPEKRTTRVRGPALAKQNASRAAAAALSIPLPALPPDLSLAALNALHRAASELRSSTQLLQFEVAVAYIASTTRLHLLYPSDSAAHSGHGAERKRWRRHIYNPAPLLRIHTFLSAWVRQRYGELVARLGGAPSTGVSTSETAAGATPAPPTPAPSTLPVPIRVSATHHDANEGHLSGYGMQAYYYLRRNQPAWGLLLEKAERLLSEAATTGNGPATGNVEGTTDMLNPALCSVMRAPPARLADDDINNNNNVNNTANHTNRPPATTADKSLSPAQQALQEQQELQIEQAGVAWSKGLFVLARCFALHYLCARDARSTASDTDSTLPLMEQRAEWEMLRTVIGAADGAEEVSFLWGPLANGGYADLKKWYEVRISVRHPALFRAEVANAPTDLMELCGEASVIEQYREKRQRLLVHICFSQVLRSCASARMATTLTASSMDVGVDSEDAGKVQQEAALALFVLQDACDNATAASNTAVAAATPVQSVLEWESSALDACAAQPLALNRHFQHMVQSFTYAVAPRKVKASTSALEPFDPRLVHLWLPGLHHPLFDLQYLTSTNSDAHQSALVSNGAILSPHLQCPSRSGNDPFSDIIITSLRGNFFGQASKCGGVATALIVVVTQRRFLSPSDVILSGAQLSPSLLRRICVLTGWNSSSAERGNKRSSDSGQRIAAEDTMAIVVRRVLVRRSKVAADTSRTQSSGTVTQAPVGDGNGRQTPVEVGMNVRWADPLSPGLVWCRTACLQAPVEGALWDTRASCRPQYNGPVSRSVSTAFSGSFLPPSHRPSENFFVTELEGGTPLRQSQMVVSAKHAWTFSDVPIPVRWNSAHGVAEAGVVEFPFCVEYDQPCQGGLSAPTFASAGEGSVNNDLDDKSVDDDVVVGGILPIQEALDAYIWID